MKKYVIELSSSERRDLQKLVTKGKASARKIQHAQILLKADESESGPSWKDQDIADAFEVSVRTIERIRKRCVEHGLEDALVRRKNPNGIQRRKLDGRGEAHLCKLACSTPPEGRESWTLQLLGDRLVELKVVDSISRETVRTTLKKTNGSLGCIRNGASLPNKMPHLYAGWNRHWTCMHAPMIQMNPWSTWMKPQSSSQRK